MYIVPNSTVYILSGIPINKNYQHTIYFDDANVQYNYFKKHVKKTFTGVSYQREKRGWMRVECSADELYNCNYIMYQNTAYNNKWFYAFIDSVEFVNNVTCEVTFTLDVMQTWFFDYTLQACFVDREHVADDTIFTHTVPENIGFGEPIVNRVQWEDNVLFSPKGVIYTASEPSSALGSETKAQTKAYGVPCNMYIGCSKQVKTNGQITGVDNIGVMNDLSYYLASGKQSALQSVYTLPVFMCDTNITISVNGGQPPKEPAELGMHVLRNTSDLNGYTPRNKKLFCYPYNFLRLSNQSGAVQDYRFEDFQQSDADKLTNSVTFKAYGTGFNNPQVVIVPQKYKFKDEFFDEAITISGYPMLPYLGDALAAYLALNSNSLAYQRSTPIYNAVKGAVGGVTNAAAGVATGNVTLALSGAASVLGTGVTTTIDSMQIEAEQLAKQADLAEVPDTAYGLSNATSVTAATDNLRPTFYSMCCKAEYAKIIDGYFDRWGYKCNEVKIPNRNVRPHWTYTRTNACTINANCPGDDEEMICNIYNNGITFWRNGDEVGNYTLDNSI